MATNQYDICEELEVLRSMYCLPGELDISEDSRNGRHIALKLKKEEEKERIVLDVKIALSSSYPSTAPEISLFSCELSAKVLKSLRQEVTDIIKENLGSPVLLHIITFLCEKLGELSTEIVGRSLNTEIHKNRRNCIMLIHLDHMRARASYIKLIKKWTNELNLCGRLIFFKRLILLLLIGSTCHLKEYIIRNRSRNVDVDSRGQSCKERMLSVLCEQPWDKQVMFHEFKVIDCESNEEVKDIFGGDLEDIYNTYVYKLSGYGLKV
ncbi:RWD domain-containing protein 3 isoform X1 [Patella vulgata]|uniref:RWD domain-containing protein 3 isoform X1 n=1 Tax=Patella vulgata TaxID=6465 RepID=UPI0021801287|nr:RWD domain-containing protein 3 isoform X1 [Patella vulgata]XP_050401370.1 RWD domain-containing protein 3 isoform X1 [Patella vulgata]XP_050401371.1 RWD domain-containing protein 3 isoform X1 [Patella vulgata]XP_050401372.1 RWD domain-containing protein 3 isoform X1 [Patella vulgata]XP_050401373.1 RWD domain-containing protein 3 isoform X1 [Patella vulgata]XP_050401374.1 RWD domain-containing protein 3 isoform X1 [Patella vulgata]XP_050401375.1 RWD domain-containing protein 3 isoform X1 [